VDGGARSVHRHAKKSPSSRGRPSMPRHSSSAAHPASIVTRARAPSRVGRIMRGLVLIEVAAARLGALIGLIARVDNPCPAWVWGDEGSLRRAFLPGCVSLMIRRCVR